MQGKILGVTDQVTNLWSGLSFKDNPYTLLDIFIVSLLIYWGYILIKETKAIRIIYGILLLGILMLLGQVFRLSALNFILKYLITMIIVAIPVVFQPELRAALEKLGRTRIVADFHLLKKNEIAKIVEQIIKTVKILAKNKTGALIVLAQKTGLRDIIETGVRIGGEISSDFLISIFYPKNPLHDGAVIIGGDKVIAASCTLPLSDEEFDFNIGTRHRAAVGLSSQTDAIVIVVSEEKGTISVAFNGQLSREISSKELEDFILTILQQKSSQKEDQVKINKMEKI